MQWTLFCVIISNVSLTFIRKTLEMHMETAHSTVQIEPTHQKDLRCPFCLYQTKIKNNMIDHILLHRGKLDARQHSVLRPTDTLMCHVSFIVIGSFVFRGTRCPNRGASLKAVTLSRRHCLPLSQMHFHKRQC